VDEVGREASLNAAYGNCRTSSHQSFFWIFGAINLLKSEALLHFESWEWAVPGMRHHI
jgi:hypothetical protein